MHFRLCRATVLERAREMRTSKAEVDLFNLTPEGQEFSMHFWQQFVGDPDEVAAGVDAEYHPIRIQVPYYSNSYERYPSVTNLLSHLKVSYREEETIQIWIWQPRELVTRRRKSLGGIVT